MMLLKIRAKGFTLIELLVVIAIIGLLASIVLASLSTARSKGQDAARISDVKSLEVALELYYPDNNNSYPHSVGVQDTGQYITSTSLGALVPKYIGSVPAVLISDNDQWAWGAGGQSYSFYIYTAANNGFCWTGQYNPGWGASTPQCKF